jgi:hypothetical protein
MAQTYAATAHIVELVGARLVVDAERVSGTSMWLHRGNYAEDTSDRGRPLPGRGGMAEGLQSHRGTARKCSRLCFRDWHAHWRLLPAHSAMYSRSIRSST